MQNSNSTAHFNTVQFLRLQNLKNNREFLSEYIEKNLLLHLEPITITPKNILNISYDKFIDFKKLNIFNKYNIFNFVPVKINETNVNKTYKYNNLFNIFSNKNNSNTYYSNDINSYPEEIKTIKFDIIYSNLAFSYYKDLPTIFKNLSALLKTNGLIIFSLFGLGTAVELPFKLLLIDMHDIGDMLLHSGFSSPVVDAQRFNVNYKTADIKSLLKDLQAFNILINTKNYPKSKLFDIFKDIKNISVECIYAHAWKKETNKIQNDTSIINIDKIINRKN